MVIVGGVHTFVGGVSGMFRCEAVYCGRRAVLGAQSSATLTLLIEHLLESHTTPAPHAHENAHTFAKLRSERCQLQCDDERLQVTPIRKDEGFESDSESSGSTCDESFCGNQDIKVISDHVLRLDHLIHHDAASTASPFTSSSSDDTSSSATSSGNESEDENPRTNPDCLGTSPASNAHTQVENGGGNVNGNNGGGVIGDTFLMSDILYCHVAPATPRVVVVVVKDAGSSQVYAHVFQCVTAEAAKALYAHYKEASNKYKLNRYRNSKRKSDANASSDPSTNSASATNSKSSSASSHKNASSGKPPRGNNNSSSSSLSKASSANINRMIEGGGRGSIRSVEARLLTGGEKRGDIGNNINVIEIRETPQQEAEEPRPWSLVQHTDANGVTHIEIESAPCSLMGSSSDPSDFNGLLSLHSQQQSGQLSMNSLTALSDHSESIAGSLQGSNSCPTSLIATEREVLVAGEVDKKSRQRQPAQFLRGNKFGLHDQQPRKSDDKRSEEKLKRSEMVKKENDYRREEKKNREENHRDEREGRSRRGRHEVELRSNTTREVSTAAQTPVEASIPRIAQERQPRPRDQSRSRLKHSHNKGPAPPPPPRRHPNNPSLLLVPTKSGAENARAFYPKESHIIRGNKIVRVEYPGYSGGWMHHDINNNPHHFNYYAHSNAWVGPHEYHAVRPRESTITNEMRRRSRSKSPARRPMAHRYIDAVSTFNISQKLKDISEAVFTNKRNNVNGPGQGPATGSNSQGNGVAQVSNGREGRGHQRSLSITSASLLEGGGGGGDGTLKSVIKKSRKIEASPQTRRVTFSAYATVQVMEA